MKHWRFVKHAIIVYRTQTLCEARHHGRKKTETGLELRKADLRTESQLNESIFCNNAKHLEIYPKIDVFAIKWINNFQDFTDINQILKLKFLKR